MAPLVAMVVGGVVRAVIAAASGAGVATSIEMGEQGVHVQDDVQALVSAVGVIITILWSAWQKRQVQ